MKKIFFTFFVLLVSFIEAQNNEILSLDFYEWNSDGINYEMALTTFKGKESNVENSIIIESPGNIRVRYFSGGKEKIVEFNCNVTFTSVLNNKSSASYFTTIIDGYGEAIYKIGEGKYTPDNFIINGLANGNKNSMIVFAYQIDDNGINNPLANKLVELKFKNYDVSQSRENVKLFFQPNEKLYKDLMAFTFKLMNKNFYQYNNKK